MMAIRNLVLGEHDLALLEQLLARGEHLLARFVERIHLLLVR
jgi:hypothetical protein